MVRRKVFLCFVGLIICLNLVLAGIPVMPPATAGDPVAELVERQKPVYDCLEDEDREVIQAAKNEIANLDIEDIKNLPEFEVLITSTVTDRLGSGAASTLATMIRDAAAVQYSTDANTLQNNLESFRRTWAPTVSQLLGGSVTLNDAWQFALGVEKKLPGVLRDMLPDLAGFIAASDYDAVLKAFSDILREAANRVDDSSFKRSIEELDWTVNQLVAVKDALRDKVPDGKAAEQALLKGYVRSVTKPQQSTTMYVGETMYYDLKVEVPGESTVFPVPGGLLKWKSLDPAVADFVDGTNALKAKSPGTATVRAYHPQRYPDDPYAWVAEFSVSVQSRPTEPGPGPAPAPPAVPPGVIPPSELNITVTDGKTNVEVPDRAINSLLDRGIVDAVVQMPEAKDIVVSLSSGAVSRLAEKGGTLTVSAAAGQVTLPAVALPKLPAGAALSVGMCELSSEEAAPVVSQLPPELKAVSGVVDVSVRADGQEVACPARLVVACSVTAGIEPKKCFIYRVKPDGTFECVGGDVVTDEAGNVVGFGVDLSRLSKYVVMEYTRTFGDTVGHWAERDILFMAARGVAKGVAPGKFEPNRPVTRAEFAALLVRALGIKPDPGRELRFADVDRSKWYYGEVAAAFSAGIVKGISADKFAPEAGITREQVAAMVARALKFAGKEIALSPGEAEARIGAYSDGSRVSAWAREEMARALKCGIVTGRTETTLVPQGDSTRAEAVAMLRRMLKQIL